MQWNLKLRKRRDERGVTAVLVGLLTTTLIAAVGMSVDVGNAYVQRQKLQTATDNAALAIAQDCALYRTTCYSANGNAPKSTANFVVGQNISDASANVVGTIGPSSTSVTVTSTKTMPFSFAKAIGVGSKTATVSATATWDRAPKEGYPLLPMAVGYCQYKANQFPATNHILIRTDLLSATLKGLIATLNLLGLPLTNWFPASTCTGSTGETLNMSNGAVWLTALIDALDLFDISNMSLCNMKVKIFTTMLVTAVTPVIAPTACVNKLKLGTIAMMPIYESYSPLTVLSSSITLRIVGFAPFKITGWQEPGNAKNDPSATPSCLNILTLTCQGIQGYFVRSVVQDPEQVFAYDSAAPDLGGVKLATRLTN
ncbi:TadE/TadG family type IV pilus assembly protein [Aeromicrobium stalagmiti]|uniref:TadE/TadG family type IV pilus assembly protein n=1 Tax=Aeromicrobium stalagmiti TaxID=2738988 RepID=UPI0015690017|nr:TadE/TadG family type IV pilus assembly protein [Aeromicrobium stalagmiti]NRQ48295.1 pilus assembly protein [Aeromicrobium stalagmiti]